MQENVETRFNTWLICFGEDELVPLLQERSKLSRAKRNLEPGDVVLIVDSSSPRHSWLMGRVVQTLPDCSGTVRRVKIQTKTNVLERPINKLCLIQEQFK